MDVTILEDDKTLSFALNKHFTKQGYKVRMFQTLQDAFASPIKAGIYLVDLSLPDGLGFEYGEIVSRHEDTFLIYLTVKDDQNNIIKGFETGSDDYVTKPFTFEELDRRIQAILKRYKPKFLTFGKLVINTDLALVTVGNDEIYLSVQEYRLLVLLMSNQNEVVLRSTLNEALNILEGTQEGTLNVAIGRLRKKLEGIVSIEAVVKQGYRITL